MTAKQALLLIMAIVGASLVWQLRNTSFSHLQAVVRCSSGGGGRDDELRDVSGDGLLIRLKIRDWCLAVPGQPSVGMAVQPKYCGGASQEWIVGVHTISPSMNPNLCMVHDNDDDDEDPPSLQFCNSSFAGWTWSSSGALMSLSSLRCLGINMNLHGQELYISGSDCTSENAVRLFPSPQAERSGAESFMRKDHAPLGEEGGVSHQLDHVHWDNNINHVIHGMEPERSHDLTLFRWSSQSEVEAWLEEAEQKFGGLRRGIPCKRGLVAGKNFTCKGGDRMTSKVLTSMNGGRQYTQKGHNYGVCYARYFDRMLARWQSVDGPFLVAEIGILQCSGLAIWSKLFPSATIFGFDFDLVTCQSNLAFLKSEGAFSSSLPHLQQMNQLSDPKKSSAMLHELLQGRRLSFVIDDGLHSDESIIKTFQAFREHLHPDGLYIVEDNHCGVGPRGYGDPKQCKKKLGQLLGQEASGYELSTCAEVPRFWALIPPTHAATREEGGVI